MKTLLLLICALFLSVSSVSQADDTDAHALANPPAQTLVPSDKINDTYDPTCGCYKHNNTDASIVHTNCSKTDSAYNTPACMTPQGKPSSSPTGASGSAKSTK